MSAFIGLKEYPSALSLLIKNRDELFKASPIKTIETDLFLRFSLEKFDEAYDDVDIFNEYPYISQEVEEELRSLRKKVRKAEKDAIRSKYKESIDLSINQSEDELLNNLGAIETKDIKNHLQEIRNIVSSLGKDDVRTYALMMLVAAEDDKEIRFLKNDSEFIVIPSKLERPFSSDDHLKFIDQVVLECKDPSLSNVALRLYSSAVISAYPEPLLENGKTLDYASAFKDIAEEYLNIKDIAPSHIDPEVMIRVRKFLSQSKGKTGAF